MSAQESINHIHLILSSVPLHDSPLVRNVVALVIR